MISYKPLFETLDLKGISLYKLCNDLNISSRTRAKFGKDENVSLETIEKICQYLDVPIEDVIEVIRQK